MGPDMTIDSVRKISDIAGGFNAPMLDWVFFGRSIAYLGDLNNDGKIEIAVGADYDSKAGYRYGGYILSLHSLKTGGFFSSLEYNTSKFRPNSPFLFTDIA